MKISRELVGGLSHLGRRKKDHAATMTRTPTRRRTGTKLRPVKKPTKDNLWWVAVELQKG